MRGLRVLCKSYRYGCSKSRNTRCNLLTTVHRLRLQIPGDYTDMTNSNARLNNTCSNCIHQKELAELKKVLGEARDEYSYQYRQHEDEISSMVEDLPSYMRWVVAKKRIEV